MRLFFRRYSRESHNNPLTRKTSSSCLAYAPLETGSFNYKYFWKDIQCNIEAPFICKHNPDFLGFHKLSNLVLDVSVDVKLSSMSLSTCLAICVAQEDSISISFVLKDRCICAKGKIFLQEIQINFM